MQTLLRDLRFALRVLLKKPGFTMVVVLTLALGIGVNSAIFSIVNAWLFRPLPATNPHELMIVGTSDDHLEMPHEVSYLNYLDVRDRSGVFADAIAYSNDAVHLSASGQAERIFIEWVTGNYFAMLGVQAAQGRTFTATEGRLPGSDPVLVLSYGFWQRQFGGNPAIVGQTVRMNGHPFTIIGIAPENFPGTDNILAVDAYVPLGARNVLYPGADADLQQKRDNDFLTVMGRLKPGVSYQQAEAAINVLAEQLHKQYPELGRNFSLLTVPETRARPRIGIGVMLPQIAGVFMALVGLVLLIACANVANLMLVRAAAREKEMAIRSALGANRLHLIRQALTESVLLAGLGGAFGLLLAYQALEWLSKIKLSIDAPVTFTLNPDWRVFVFTLTAVLLTGLIAGGMPAFRSAGVSLSESLKEGGRSSSGTGRQRLRSLLVISQIAISLLLLICAGLFVRSARNAQQMDFGFRRDHILMLSLDVELQGYDEPRGREFQRQLLERVAALPGVQSAGLSRVIPLGYSNATENMYIEGRAHTREEEKESVFASIVSPGYFETLGVSLLRGRAFTRQDDDTTTQVAVINETLARQFWPNQEPLGKRFRLQRDGPLVEVVGVAGNGKYVTPGEDPRPFLYLPLRQHYRSDVSLFVHTAADPMSVAAPVRQAVRELDAELPVYDLKTMESHLRDGIALLFVRLSAWFSTVFGLLGLVLATTGIYGVIAWSVSQRTHEIGVRLALGASRWDVLRMIIRQGLLLALIGVGIGLVAAFGVTRLMTSLMYGVSATDLLTFSLVSVVLLLVSLLACYLPARRAASTDPLEALRYE